MDERRLILLAQEGDVDAFEELVNRYASYVYNLALRVLRNPQEAEEITQEAFLRVWRALGSYRVEARFSTWLYRIVTNLCYDRLPKLKKSLSALDPEEAHFLEDKRLKPEEQIISEELKIELHDAIDKLPEIYRLLITLRHLQEMSYTEIAQVTGQPLGTVKTGIFRARKMLAERIGHYERQHP